MSKIRYFLLCLLAGKSMVAINLTHTGALLLQGKNIVAIGNQYLPNG